MAPAVSQSSRAPPSCAGWLRPPANGDRDAHPAASRAGPARPARRRARRRMGEARLRRDLRRCGDRLRRGPDLPDLRLLLRAAVGTRGAAPAAHLLPGVRGADRAPAERRLWRVPVVVRTARRPADDRRDDRVVRGARGGPVPPFQDRLLADRRRGRRGAPADAVQLQLPRGARVRGHPVSGCDHLGGRARGRTAPPRRAGLRAAAPRRADAPRGVAAGGPLLALVRVEGQQSRPSSRSGR